MYKELLNLAIANLKEKNCIVRVMPTQSRQILHFQTFKATPEEYEEFKKTGHCKTIYALDFIIKYRAENMHDTANCCWILFQGEKIYERKKGFFDFEFFKIRKDFENTFNAITDFIRNKKIKQFQAVSGIKWE